MRKTIATLALAVAAVIPATAASADVVYEEGATFDGGVCVEADGTPGVAMPDGQCLTAADYDALFSFENLSETPSAIDGDVSIAAEAGLVDDGTAPSDRKNGEGLVEVPTSFKEDLVYLHGLPVRLA